MGALLDAVIGWSIERRGLVLLAAAALTVVGVIAASRASLDALRSDVGIVYAPGGRVAMAITVDGMHKPEWTPDNPGLLMIADLAKLLVDGLSKK